MTFDDIETIYIPCDCHTELLELTKDHEYNLVYVAMYSYGSQFSTSWKNRLKHIWRIIRYGTPWRDQITLNEKSQLELINFLLKRKGNMNE